MPAFTWPRVLLLSAALVALVCLPARTDPPKGKRYALLVGVTKYNHASLPDLEHTENDVEELGKVLRGKSAAFDEVVLLTAARGEKDDKASPTAANIRAQLKRLLDRVTKHDLVLIGLSGHGLQLTVTDPSTKTDKEESFFCPSDARPRDTKDLKEQEKTMIALSELFRELNDSGVGVKLMLVDACRNEPKSGRNPDTDNLPRPTKGTAALFSCKGGEKAFETSKLGRGHGIFFYHVIAGLKGEAKNNKGEVTWGALVEHVTEKVPDSVASLIREGAKQTPQQITNLTGKPIVLLRPDEGIVERPKTITNSVGMKFARVPRGKFMMGSPRAEQDDVLDELKVLFPNSDYPEQMRDYIRGEAQHEVEITRDFYLGVYEVTQKQFRTVTGYNPSFYCADARGKEGDEYKEGEPGGGKDKVKGLDTDDFPVENVSFANAEEFIKKLNARAAEKKLGLRYRLPTEAEWEYACRGGPKSSTSPFHFAKPSKSLSHSQANFDSRFPYAGGEKGDPLGRTCKVGSYEPNALGLYDMHGNVAEMCSDWFGRDYYKDSPRKDPAGPSEGIHRVVRGGSSANHGGLLRAARRVWADPSGRNFHGGFRVVAVLAE